MSNFVTSSSFEDAFSSKSGGELAEAAFSNDTEHMSVGADKLKVWESGTGHVGVAFTEKRANDQNASR